KGLARGAPGGERRGGQAADQPNEMSGVDVQVDGRAAGLGDVADGRGPVRPGDDALELPALELAVAFAARCLREKRKLGKEWQHMTDHEQPTGLTGGGDHAVGRGGLEGN